MHEFLSRQEKSFHETHKMESLKMVHLVEIPIDHIQQLSAIIWFIAILYEYTIY